jgi:hypothetical protein
MTWRHAGTMYEIEFSNPDRVWTGVLEATLDGVLVDHRSIPLAGDQRTHTVRIKMGRK